MKLESKTVAGVAVLFILGIGLALLPQRADSRAPQMSDPEPIPAYHPQIPEGPLPATLSPELFDVAEVQNAYAIAARIKKTLYQVPCYCHCDRSHGHGSLLDCFVSKHASVCEICMRETFFSYEQGRKGKTAAQIREAIIRDDWKSVNVSKYQTYPAAK
jgi:hypothetical protein